MSRLLTGIVLIAVIFLSACSGSHHASSSKGYLKSSAPQNNPNANNAYTPANAAPTIDKSQYIPFSRELQMKLSAYNVDVKRVQFYIDQKLVLTRNLDSAKEQYLPLLCLISRNKKPPSKLSGAHTARTKKFINPISCRVGYGFSYHSYLRR